MEGYLTTSAAAKRLGVCKASIDQYCRKGLLPSEMVGIIRLIKEADLAAFQRPPMGYPKGRPRPKRAKCGRKKSSNANGTVKGAGGTSSPARSKRR